VWSEEKAWFKSLRARVTLFPEGVGDVLAANAAGSGVCRRGGLRLYAGKCYPPLNQAEENEGLWDISLTRGRRPWLRPDAPFGGSADLQFKNRLSSRQRGIQRGQRAFLFQ
jgi:hypothetical protein